MKRFFVLLFSVFVAISGFSQGSPLKLVNFHKVPNDIVDLVELRNKAGRDCDFDSNKAALIRVKAQGFNEKAMLDFTVLPKPGVEIIYKEYKNGEIWLYVSSKCMGTIVFKYMGEFEFAFPNKLEPKAGYELMLGMETATLVIRTVPVEAEIYVDNNLAGRGEAICSVSIGAEHRYRVVCENYYSMEDVARFVKSERKELNVELEPNFGYITIKTEPGGADIYIDEEKVGITPYLMKKLKFGNHVVELRKDNYEIYADVVSVNKGEVNRQLENVQLTMKKIVMGAISVTSNPDGADITVDGEFKGQTPQTFNIITGEHKVVLVKSGCISASKTVMVYENQTANVNLSLPMGREVAISSNKNDDMIYVDDNYVGKSPLTVVLSYGQHVIRAVRDNRTSKKTITITANGGDTSVVLEFNDNRTFTVNGVTFEMVLVKGGSFTMGCTSQIGDCDEDERPAHDVTLSDYYIGKYEVTQGLWRAVMGSEVTWNGGWTGEYGRGDNFPVYRMSWEECQEFVRRLNQKTGLSFRLPTEAEWEYAARGGEKSQGYRYCGSNNLSSIAWYSYNGGSMAHPVGLKAPNELGIYDMSGNVCELCHDWYGNYSRTNQTNPTGPNKGEYRSCRGGSWYHGDRCALVSHRNYATTDNRDASYGFRIVLIP